MWTLKLPVIEKILRPVLVYLSLIMLLRVFGKRELAQLNPFDLVVLLSVSNTVQNAIIGDDNSLIGGSHRRGDALRDQLCGGALSVSSIAASTRCSKVRPRR